MAVGVVLSLVGATLAVIVVPAVSGTPSASAVTVQVPFQGGGVSAGYDHACAIETTTGAVWCWGDNSHGQLGINDASVTSSAVALEVSGNGSDFVNSGVAMVAAGTDVTCAVKSGSVFCWGDGARGTLGDGGTGSATAPQKIPNTAGFTNDRIIDIDARVDFNYGGSLCAIRDPQANADGTNSDGAGILYCWGSNAFGRLGFGGVAGSTFLDLLEPTAVLDNSAAESGFTNDGSVSHVSQGYWQTCAVQAGVVYCAGMQNSYSLGTGQNIGNQSGSKTLFVRVIDQAIGGAVTPFTNTTTSAQTTPASWTSNEIMTGCAVQSGTIFCWGSFFGSASRIVGMASEVSNYNGAQPTAIRDDAAGFTNDSVTSVSVSNESVACLIRSASVYCWGQAFDGQLGLGSATSATLPTLLSEGDMPNTSVEVISATGQYLCASESGGVYCWGSDNNSTGHLGIGTFGITASVPTSVVVEVDAPSAPTNVTLDSQDDAVGSVTLSFTAAVAPGASTLQRYEYSIDGGSTWERTSPDTAGAATSMTITGLVASASLNITLRAVSDIAPGVASSPVAVSNLGCTDCPTITTVRPADPDLPSSLVLGDRVAVTGTGFDTPSSITLSGIACTLDAATLTPTAFECDLASSGTPVGTEISFLTNGQALAIGNANSVVWATTPRAPTALNPVTGDGEIVLGFAPPVSPDGSPMSFEYSFDAGSTWVTPSPTVSSSPVTISGLAPGTYTVTLRAVNDSGAGAVATTSALSVACATCPGIPTDVAALPGDAEIVVAFTAPGSGSAPTNYQYTTTSGSTWVSFDPAVTTSPVTISGLANATRYTVAIRAVVSVSGIVYPGAPSVTVSVTAGVPASPGLVAGNVNPGDGEIVVSFTDPPSTSSSPITNYEYTLDGGTIWRAFSPSVTNGPVTISGLASGTYDLALRPVNSVGTGDATEVVTTSVVCSLCPTAPTDLVGAPANGAIEITFTDPVPPSGMIINNYEYTTTSGLTWVALSPAVTTSPVTVPGFTNGQDAVVAIRAQGKRVSDNALFPGSASVTVSARPGTPTAGTGPTLTTGDGNVQVSFGGSPQSTDSSGISNFEFSLDGGATWTAMNPAVSAAPFTIEGLVSGSYSVSIRARNSSGPGVATPPMSVNVTCSSCPDAPTDLEVVPGNGVAVIDFTAPTAPGGTTLADYEYSTTSGLTWVSLGSVTSPVTVSGLTNLQDYDISLRAVTSNGALSYRSSSSTTVSVTPGLPSAPRELTLAAGDGEIEITFDDPVFTGVSPLVTYEVTTTSGVTWVALSPAVTTSPITLDGLTNGTTYGIALRAVTAQGSGQASPVISGTPVATGAGSAPPAPPAVVPGPSAPPTPGVSGPRPLVAPVAGTPPSIVGPQDVPRLQQPPGAASASVDGVETPVVVRSVSSDVAATPPADRSPQQVAAIRSTARDLIDRLEPSDDTTDPTSSLPRLEVVDTPTGAELTGVLVDPRDGVTPVPVPVEDVRLVEVGDTRVLLAAADYRGTPARVVEGVLEVTQGGAVAALATGLPAGVPGEVVVLSTPQLMGTFTSDASGRFAGQLELPDGLEAGPHTVVLASGGITVSLGVVVHADTGMLPVRALDTRRAESVEASRLQAGETRRIRIAGTTGVGLDATSVTVNVTVVDPADAGYVRLASCDAGDIEVSTVNFAAGETVANTAILGLGSGELCAYASAPVDLVIDVLDSRDRGFTPVEPRRLVDTRAPETSRPEAGEVTVVAVAGRGGVPLDATAVVLNVTVVDADGWGFATVFACDGTPSTSNLNYTHGQTRANLVVTALGADGTVCVSSYARADLVVDVFGWYDDEFTPVSHTRLFDTRAPGSTGDGIAAGEGRVEAGEVRRVRILGRGGLGSAPTTVAVNLTLVDALGAGWARIWACDAREPETSNVNVVAGDTRANAALVVFTDDADLCLRSTVDAHVLIDVTGAFED